MDLQAVYTCEKGSNHCAIYTQLELLQHIPASHGVLLIIGIVMSDNCKWWLGTGGDNALVAADSSESNAATVRSSEINGVGRKKKDTASVFYTKWIIGNVIYRAGRFNLE